MDVDVVTFKYVGVGTVGMEDSSGPNMNDQSTRNETHDKLRNGTHGVIYKI